MRLRFVFLTLALLISLSGSLLGGETLFSFEGQVLQADGKPFKDSPIYAFLQGVTIPYNASKPADLSGKFKFSKLRRAMYTLVIVVANHGELRKTVDVSPSLADEKNRIRETIRFETSQPVDATVAAVDLSVPAKAQREYDRATEKLESHDVAGAQEALKKAVTIAPQFAMAWNKLGVLSYQTADFTGAETYFRKALEADPSQYSAHVNLGGVLIAVGRYEESLPYNQRAVIRAPEDPLAHAQLGQSYYYLGRYEEAERSLKQAKALDPRHFSRPQIFLAGIFDRQKRWAEWTAELEEYLRYHPDGKVSDDIRGLLRKSREEGRPK